MDAHQRILQQRIEATAAIRYRRRTPQECQLHLERIRHERVEDQEKRLRAREHQDQG